MTFATLKQAQLSLLEFTPALRCRHALVQLPSGRYCRVLGTPDKCTHVRGNVWRVCASEVV